jgi:hypothetical protein
MAPAALAHHAYQARLMIEVWIRLLCTLLLDRVPGMDARLAQTRALTEVIVISSSGGALRTVGRPWGDQPSTLRPIWAASRRRTGKLLRETHGLGENTTRAVRAERGREGGIEGGRLATCGGRIRRSRPCSTDRSGF